MSSSLQPVLSISIPDEDENGAGGGNPLMAGGGGVPPPSSSAADFGPVSSLGALTASTGVYGSAGSYTSQTTTTATALSSLGGDNPNSINNNSGSQALSPPIPCIDLGGTKPMNTVSSDGGNNTYKKDSILSQQQQQQPHAAFTIGEYIMYVDPTSASTPPSYYKPSGRCKLPKFSEEVFPIVKNAHLSGLSPSLLLGGEQQQQGRSSSINTNGLMTPIEDNTPLGMAPTTTNSGGGLQQPEILGMPDMGYISKKQQERLLNGVVPSHRDGGDGVGSSSNAGSDSSSQTIILHGGDKPSSTTQVQQPSRTSRSTTYPGSELENWYIGRVLSNSDDEVLVFPHCSVKDLDSFMDSYLGAGASQAATMASIIMAQQQQQLQQQQGKRKGTTSSANPAATSIPQSAFFKLKSSKFGQAGMSTTPEGAAGGSPTPNASRDGTPVNGGGSQDGGTLSHVGSFVTNFGEEQNQQKEHSGTFLLNQPSVPTVMEGSVGERARLSSTQNSETSGKGGANAFIPPALQSAASSAQPTPRNTNTKRRKSKVPKPPSFQQQQDDTTGNSSGRLPPLPSLPSIASIQENNNTSASQDYASLGAELSQYSSFTFGSQPMGYLSPSSAVSPQSARGGGATVTRSTPPGDAETASAASSQSRPTSRQYSRSPGPGGGGRRRKKNNSNPTNNEGIGALPRDGPTADGRFSKEALQKRLSEAWIFETINERPGISTAAGGGGEVLDSEGNTPPGTGLGSSAPLEGRSPVGLSGPLGSFAILGGAGTTPSILSPGSETLPSSVGGGTGILGASGGLLGESSALNGTTTTNNNSNIQQMLSSSFGAGDNNTNASFASSIMGGGGGSTSLSNLGQPAAASSMSAGMGMSGTMMMTGGIARTANVKKSHILIRNIPIEEFEMFLPPATANSGARTTRAGGGSRAPRQPRDRRASMARHPRQNTLASTMNAKKAASSMRRQRTGGAAGGGSLANPLEGSQMIKSFVAIPKIIMKLLPAVWHMFVTTKILHEISQHSQQLIHQQSNSEISINNALQRSTSSNLLASSFPQILVAIPTPVASPSATATAATPTKVPAELDFRVPDQNPLPAARLRQDEKEKINHVDEDEQTHQILHHMESDGAGGLLIKRFGAPGSSIKLLLNNRNQPQQLLPTTTTTGSTTPPPRSNTPTRSVLFNNDSNSINSASSKQQQKQLVSLDSIKELVVRYFPWEVQPAGGFSPLEEDDTQEKIDSEENNYWRELAEVLATEMPRTTVIDVSELRHRVLLAGHEAQYSTIADTDRLNARIKVLIDAICFRMEQVVEIVEEEEEKEMDDQVDGAQDAGDVDELMTTTRSSLQQTMTPRDARKRTTRLGLPAPPPQDGGNHPGYTPKDEEELLSAEEMVRAKVQSSSEVRETTTDPRQELQGFKPLNANQLRLQNNTDSKGNNNNSRSIGCRTIGKIRRQPDQRSQGATASSLLSATLLQMREAPVFQALTSVSLCSMNLTDSIVSPLVKMAHRLTSLSLSKNQLEDATAQLFLDNRSLEAHPTTIPLSGGDYDEGSGGGVVEECELLELRLDGNPFGEKGIWAIREMVRKNHSLKFLDIRNVRAPLQAREDCFQPLCVPVRQPHWTKRLHSKSEKTVRHRLRLIAHCLTRGNHEKRNLMAPVHQEHSATATLGSKSERKSGGGAAAEAMQDFETTKTTRLGGGSKSSGLLVSSCSSSQGTQPIAGPISKDESEGGRALECLFEHFSVFARPRPLRIAYQ